jgi:hypothetical protein
VFRSSRALSSCFLPVVGRSNWNVCVCVCQVAVLSDHSPRSILVSAFQDFNQLLADYMC